MRWSSKWAEFDEICLKAAFKTKSPQIHLAKRASRSQTYSLFSVLHHLDWVGVREKVDDLKGGAHNAHGLQLLAAVATVVHQHESHSLHDGALSLAEAFAGISACCVRCVHGVLALGGFKQECPDCCQRQVSLEHIATTISSSPEQQCSPRGRCR